MSHSQTYECDHVACVPGRVKTIPHQTFTAEGGKPSGSKITKMCKREVLTPQIATLGVKSPVRAET